MIDFSWHPQGVHRNYLNLLETSEQSYLYCFKSLLTFTIVFVMF
jgi:hypothetical protein